MLGVSVGITGLILLFLFIDSERSYDKFHKDYSKIFRLTTIYIENGKEHRFALNEGLWDDILVTDVPGVSNSTAFVGIGRSSFYINEKNIVGNVGLAADADFLKVFGYTILSGSDDFDGTNNIIITRQLALKLFDDVDCSGKMLEVQTGNGSRLLLVSAVIEDLPLTSSIQFDHVVRGSGAWWDQQFAKTDRTGNTLYIYFKTMEEVNLSQLQSNVDMAFSKHIMKFSGNDYLTPIQRLIDVHFNSDNQFEMVPGGNADYMKIFTFIIIGFGLLTLMNSNNINSLHYYDRIKEIGVRKLFGCNRLNLAKLFLFDSVFKTTLSTLVAIIVSYFILLKIDLSIFSIGPSTISERNSIVRVFVGCIVLGIVAGLYPVSKLLTMQIANAFKGNLLQSKEWILSIGNIIIVAQIFSAATMFTLGLVVLRQIDFLNHKSLGYNRSNLISFYKSEHLPQHLWKSFQEKLSNETVFSSIGTSSTQLFKSLSIAYFRGNGHNFQAHWFTVDAKFLETLQVKFLAGHNFTKTSSDVREVIINKAARQELAQDQDPINTIIETWFGKCRIVGVTDDFHFSSFNSKITPLVMVLDDDRNGTMYARFVPERSQHAVETAQKIWSSLKPDDLLDYEFFDDTFTRTLEREHQTKIIVIIFTVISLIVTAVGLTGLIAHMTRQYRKEIAIRKVLGSTVWQILKIFGKQFLFLISIGIILSIPISLWLSEMWLSNFEFKMASHFLDISCSMFAIFLITFSVISYQAIGAAVANPVHVLKNE